MSPIKAENIGRYPKHWREVSNYIRFTRADGRCECHGECGTRGAKSKACAEPDLTGRCRAEHGKPNPRTMSTVVLTVAHLDDNPESDDPTRLRAMCQACHLAYDTRLHVANRAAAARGDMLPLFGSAS